VSEIRYSAETFALSGKPIAFRTSAKARLPSSSDIVKIAYAPIHAGEDKPLKTTAVLAVEVFSGEPCEEHDHQIRGRRLLPLPPCRGPFHVAAKSSTRIPEPNSPLVRAIRFRSDAWPY
jgi:hypothetical protein